MFQARTTSFLAFVVLTSVPASGYAREITELIPGNNRLMGPAAIAVDASGNAYVAGISSDKAFKITPNGVITQIIDWSGDGMGNILYDPYAVAVDVFGNAYVTGFGSNNAFKIELCDTLEDYALFAACLTGPHEVVDATCACPDDDADADVDLADYARFQITFTGP